MKNFSKIGAEIDPISSICLYIQVPLVDHLRPLHISTSSRIIAHGILRNSVLGVSAQGVRQKTSFSIRYGGVSLRTGISKTPLPEFLRMGTSFSIRHGGVSLRTGREPQKLHYRSFCAWEPQKLRFWSFCAPSAPENLVPYTCNKAR